MGYRGNYQTKLDWPTILKLYAAGDGTKAIAKAVGCQQASIREGLIKRGVYQFGQNRKRNQSGVWAGYYDAEIAPMAKWEREHDRLWRMAHPKPKWWTTSEGRAMGAKNAKKRYVRVSHTPEYKAKQFARNQLARIKRQALGYAKNCRTHFYLGCSYQQAADHITKQLPAGWTWDNYGSLWEIDHITQLSDGPLLDQSHMLRVCHYSNLRPMAVTQNRSRPRGVHSAKQVAVA